MDGHFWRGLLVLGGAALLFFVLYRLGMFSTSALVKDGYAGSVTPHAWSARYRLLSGFSTRGHIRLGSQPVTVAVEIETAHGSLGLRIEGDNGMVFYDGSNLLTSSFTVTALGTVSMRIDAEGHGGGYSIRW